MTRDYSAADLFPAALIIVIGIAEGAHLGGLLLHLSFRLCALLFGIAVAIGLAALAAAAWKLRSKESRKEKTPVILCAALSVIVICQAIFILTNPALYLQGDMTAETVVSFLQSDAVYRVNPLTGLAYSQGIPARLKILGLPTLYGALCSLFSLQPGLVIWRIAPLCILICCYGAYAALGKCIFPEDRKKRCCFLIAVGLVLMGSSYLYGLDGFGVMYSGWRGVTIRSAVLVPWTVSLCLRKKWFAAFICVMAEACIVWTLYGMGACFLVIIGMKAADVVCRRAKLPAAGEEAVK